MADEHHAALATTLITGIAEQAEPAVKWDPVDPAAAAEIGLSRFLIIRGGEGVTADDLVEALSQHGDLFESVEADAPGTVLGTGGPNDPLFAAQYGLHNTGAPIGGNQGVPHADISALGAWAIAGGSPVTIAIVDTGVSHSHPDLVSKLVPGWNFVGSDPAATDDSVYLPHGTACAGIAAATGNDAFGISGVSWNGRVMPVRVADIWGNSSETACANGIIWAVDHGARVISVSLGYTAGTAYLRAAVTYATTAGAVIIAAAGNTPGVQVYYPARFPEVIAVTATDNRDILGPFCTTGPEVDVCAPGVQIMTTTDTAAIPNGHRYETGTSMAAPFVSGIAALLLETAPWLSSSEVRRILRETADDLGPPGWDPQYGHGRVNAERALSSLFDEDQVCPGDWNGDGVISPDDLFAYLGSFFSGRGDVNGDGVTTVLDLTLFIQHFATGC